MASIRLSPEELAARVKARALADQAQAAAASFLAALAEAEDECLRGISLKHIIEYQGFEAS